MQTDDLYIIESLLRRYKNLLEACKQKSLFTGKEADLDKIDEAIALVVADYSKDK